MPYSDPHDRYPSIDNLHCDPRMARLLFRAYYDELNSVSTCIYNSIQLAEECTKTATLFESLAMTEMRHFRILGKAIRRLGGNPVIRTDLRITSFEVCPDAPRPRIEQTVKNAVRIAIASKQTAAWEYRALADKTCDGTLKQLLCRLAAEEEEHARMLQNLCDC